MSAGVLPVIVKVFPVLEGVHTHSLSLSLTHTHSHTRHGHKYFLFSFSLWNLSHALKSTSSTRLVPSRKRDLFPVTCSLHSHNTEVVETCYSASSSLLHNHVVDHFPTRVGKFGSAVTVRGISCRPEGLLRPSKHQEYPALEKVPTPCEKKPNTAGTSGSFSLLVEKERTISARLTVTVLWQTLPPVGTKTRRTVKRVGPSL